MKQFKNIIELSDNNQLMLDFINKDLTNETKTSIIYTNGLYHSDWNWLMEVVEKIESLGSCQIDISFNWCRIGYKGNTIDSRNYLKNSSKIEAVYNACLEFIKWYNNQN